MNSINEAMYYGVPMLVMPITSDQPINAERVEELQIGKSIKKFCSAKTIYKKTMEVLNNASIKTNAEAIQKKVHTDIGVSGVADNIERMLGSTIEFPAQVQEPPGKVPCSSGCKSRQGKV